MERDGYKKYKKIIDGYVAQCNDSNLVEIIGEDKGTKHYVLENGIHVYIKQTRNVGHDIIKVSTHELASMEKSEGMQNAQETYLESEVYNYPSVSLVIGEYTSGDFPKEKAFIQYNHNEIDEKILYSLPKSFKKYDYHSEKVELEEDFEERYDIEKILEIAIKSENLSPEVRQMYEEALKEYKLLISIPVKKKEDQKAKLVSEIKGLIEEDKKIDVELAQKSKTENQK